MRAVLVGHSLWGHSINHFSFISFIFTVHFCCGPVFHLLRGSLPDLSSLVAVCSTYLAFDVCVCVCAAERVVVVLLCWFIFYFLSCCSSVVGFSVMTSNNKSKTATGYYMLIARIATPFFYFGFGYGAARCVDDDAGTHAHRTLFDARCVFVCVSAYVYPSANGPFSLLAK